MYLKDNKSRVSLIIVFAALLILLFFYGLYSNQMTRADGQKYAMTLNSMQYASQAFVGESRFSEDRGDVYLELSGNTTESYFNMISIRELGDAILLQKSTNSLIDAWGNTLYIHHSSGEYAIISCGPNTKWNGGEKDDIVFILSERVMGRDAWNDEINPKK